MYIDDVFCNKIGDFHCQNVYKPVLFVDIDFLQCLVLNHIMLKKKIYISAFIMKCYKIIIFRNDTKTRLD